MKEIEEIAEQASIDTLGRISPAFEIGYIVGTNDAINKACKWLEDFGWKILEAGDYQPVINDFRKAMKGE